MSTKQHYQISTVVLYIIAPLKWLITSFISTLDSSYIVYLILEDLLVIVNILIRQITYSSHDSGIAPNRGYFATDHESRKYILT